MSKFELYELNIDQFELFKLVCSLRLEKHFLVERFEATVSRSTEPSPLLNAVLVWHHLDRCCVLLVSPSPCLGARPAWVASRTFVVKSLRAAAARRPRAVATAWARG